MNDRGDALARCVGAVAEFAESAWGRRPAHRRGGPGSRFDDLLSAADVDRLITTSGLRTPALRLVRDGRPLPPKAFTKQARTGGVAVTGLADPVKVQRELANGATLVLQGLHRYWEPLARFCRDLEWALGHPTQVNAYVTPAGARGLAVHEDPHDVFVLQSFGSKHWHVWETGAGLDAARAGTARPAITAVLEPGDSLYIPRGTPHAAEAQTRASGHLTVGILVTTWLQVLRRALEGLGEEPELAEPLPVGFHTDRPAFAALVEDRVKSLRTWVERLDADDVAAREVRRFLTSRPPLVGGGVEDVLGLDALADDTLVRRRRGSICVLEPDGETLRVLLGDRELRMPAWTAPVMELLAGLEHLTPADLHEHLDEPGRRALVRRLVREGLLEVVR